MIKYLFFLSAFAIASLGFAQQNSPEQDKKEVQAVIEKLFKGMYQADTAMVRETFHPTARLQSVFTHRTKKTAVLHTEKDVNGFIKSIAEPHAEPYDEQIESYEIRVDEHLATVWTPYKFFVGKTYSHAGVNAFHLVRDEAGKWKITQITDTRRK
jgi:hypothetical protein